ncbi:DNA alkylation repair protein [Enterococcus avium]|uniref:DNA alkylation repair protein n=1 Tax=Enterococcus malodoratus TaxID=71451 RepID=UPI0008BD1681|nr:DNA alkylation repair protein [Enterococcus malodoratus]BBM17045.1 DNA alkylation repair protein [Enterococcus avium]SES94780.1 3-methyladenine DNA glycosylase AlkC [Enterococcus malodoratus]
MKHKDHYNDQYILDLSEKLTQAIPDFPATIFSNELIGNLEDKELFARFDFIVDALEKNLSENYSENIQAFCKILGPELEQSTGMFSFGWWLWPIGRYVERHGNENWQVSLDFLKELTKRFTGEYAIRPLLKEHPQEVMDELIRWSQEDNVHVRRLACEGVRTRLPWSEKIFVALEEFDRYAIILTNLKDDPEKFVQKSVGNNLNDLYKDAPEKADYLISEWQKTPSSKAQEWIIKHSRRNQKKSEA